LRHAASKQDFSLALRSLLIDETRRRQPLSLRAQRSNLRRESCELSPEIASLRSQ
jgi:hypothetical protein